MASGEKPSDPKILVQSQTLPEFVPHMNVAGRFGMLGRNAIDVHRNQVVRRGDGGGRLMGSRRGWGGVFREEGFQLRVLIGEAGKGQLTVESVLELVG